MTSQKIGRVTYEITASAMRGESATDAKQGDYSDGSDEALLYKLFLDSNPEARRQEVLANNPSWPMRYHLDYMRENLLNWYPFEPEASLLEIGAGCGALTGVFTAHCNSVTAVELTTQRSKIIAQRHQKAANLKVVAANFMAWESRERYDYVVLSGVLEYAARFVEADNPYQALLQKAGSYLKPGGALILAIENKLGLKYWAGAREDHTWRFFDSIENYPADTTMRTFSRKELIDLFADTGYNSTEFYYPTPDMKLPSEVFSDAYLPHANHPVSSGSLPAPAFDAPRKYVFNEQHATQTVIDAGLFPEFANSFLVFARSKA